MNEPTVNSVISADTVIEGDVVAKSRVTVSGRVQGDLSAHSVEISETGGVYGSLRAQNADVHGDVQGDVSVRGLIRIGKTGSVNGDVQYGSINLEQGGMLSASLRNVPPQLGGDLELTVKRGASVRITTLDLTAFDPDDKAEDLNYSVSNAKNGFVALASARDVPVSTFTQKELEQGHVFFVHSGTSEPSAGFDTMVADASGATSGAMRHVKAIVKG